MKVSVVIPARYESSRFPGKLLKDLCGQPVLKHVWDLANKVKNANEVVIATIDEHIQAAAESWGARVLMGNPDATSGTDCILSIIEELQGDFIVNLQGDEPFTEPELIDQLIALEGATNADIVTPVFRIETHEELVDPNLVKAVRAEDGHALYFSRSPVPFLRGKDIQEWTQAHHYYGHIGIYGMKRDVLKAYSGLSSQLEGIESLEQLRFLENSYTIQTLITEHKARGIDTPEDLEHARAALSHQK